jgi:hypothetical protein
MISRMGGGVQSVSAEQAADFLDKTTFLGQRKLDLVHVRYLAGLMRDGSFRPASPAEFAELPDGRRFLVNGQHTMSAIVDYGGAIDLNITIYSVDDMVGIGVLYNTFDRNKPRSLKDNWQALDMKKRYAMLDNEVTAFGRAAPFIAGNFGYRPTKIAQQYRSPDLRARVMDNHHEAARQFMDCLKPAEPAIRRALLYPPVLALGVYTVAHDHDRAVRFWILAADDQNLSKTDPPKAATMLAQRPMKGILKTQVALAQSLIAVWNAYVVERQMKHPKLLKDPSDAVRILGTPLAEDAQDGRMPLDPDSDLLEAIEHIDSVLPPPTSPELRPTLN